MANGVIGYLKTRLQSLSVKTGVVVAFVCVLCYAFSFLQMLLPVSAVLKGILWVVFYGLAKACQYASLIILGKSGFSMLRAYFARKAR